ncbi:DNA phosphorothioation-dependent restriction protein DptG [Clostridium paraputrificum]|uniref:DNA phosphorothioation-dependent restriction protein DptG n=1 Tax=Clostridium paraputrificum TaxID=29363 RepID=UPI0034A45F1F
MSENMEYKIDLELIKENFKFTDKGLTHKSGNIYKILPYSSKLSNSLLDFTGVVGAFSRLISNKEIGKEFDLDTFINEVVEQVGEYKGAVSKEVFKDIVRTMFICDGNLVDFDIKTINYLAATSSDEKLAKFIYSVLFDEVLEEKVINQYNRDINNILYKLVLKALPELKDRDVLNGEYECYLPFVKELFIKDFTFLIEHEEFYKNSLKRFLEYYYMFYISQLAVKLNKFDEANLFEADRIYYTLSWESTSKSRTAYRLGWKLLKPYVDNLFSHAIVLDLLNHNNLESNVGYVELARIFNSIEKDKIEKELESLLSIYTKQIKDVEWNSINFNNKVSDNNGFEVVYRIFQVIEYQFDKTTRHGIRKKYKDCYENFLINNFLKRRGTLGYNLNITEDDIILMTKICIKDRGKLKLKSLFEEFEKRGLFFDRDSKVKIIQLYEKLNLLEKKSDSGDAQYVRSVL